MFSFRNLFLSSKRRRTVAIWLTIALSVTIAALTLMPISAPNGVPGSDKFHHMVAFAALTLPCAALYPKALPKTVIAAVIYGGIIEIIQPYLGRSGEFADFIADLVGIGLGVTVGLLFNRAVLRSLSQRPVRS